MMRRVGAQETVVLLTSSSLANKGDALMLETVTRRLGSGLRYAIPSNCAFASPRHAKDYSWCLCTDRPAITTKRLLFESSVRALAAVSAAVPEAVRRSSGVLREEDIDVVIDLSGYCYGDHWGKELIEKATRQYARHRSRGVPVVLMPKTWGPFDKIGSAAVDALLENVDIAFARDDRSLELLRACLQPRNREKVFFAPDYTHEIGKRPGELRHRRLEDGPVYIIPSYRVVDSGAYDKGRYVRLLALARQHIERLGAEAVLLIHEASSDHFFLRAADDMGFRKDQAIVEPEPARLKAIISEAAGVITSRLHGLYNALNSCVPVAAIPWSFKYEAALEQYGCGELLVDMSRPEGSLEEKIAILASPAHRSDLSRRMSERRDALQSLTEEMWMRIERTITGAIRG